MVLVLHVLQLQSIGFSLFLISPLFPGDHTCVEGAGDNVLMKMNIVGKFLLLICKILFS